MEALEAACGIQVVVFDKTGTLTLGKLAVDSSAYYCQTDITWASTAQGIQSAVRALTASSLHPVSAAIHEYLSVLDPQGSVESLDVRVVPGKGVEADFGGMVVRGGSAAWADGEGTTDSGNHTVFVVSVASNPVSTTSQPAQHTNHYIDSKVHPNCVLHSFGFASPRRAGYRPGAHAPRHPSTRIER